MKVGAILIGADGKMIGSGYNDFPTGVVDTPERRQRPTKFTFTEHAERNAIYDAARCGYSTNGATMYCTWFPCADCARGIVQSGVKILYCTRPDLTSTTWGEAFKAALAILTEAGIEIRYCP